MNLLPLKWLGLATALWLGHAKADLFEHPDVIWPPAVERFSVCHGYGCDRLSVIGLSAQQWGSITALFLPASRHAEQERERVRTAIARFEKLVGALTGTSRDKGGDLPGFGEDGQMDCIDESINTSVYLKLLQQHGLLRFHRLEDRSTRGWFIFGFPHTTAVMRDITTGQQYAVDAWFLDNGEPPFILPLAIWQGGWTPQDEARQFADADNEMLGDQPKEPL